MDAGDEAYAQARMTLDGALAEFVKASENIGMEKDAIARNVCDSLFDATDGDIKLDATVED